MCMFCRSLFVLLSFYFWPLCCLSSDLQILITPLVTSNSSCKTLFDCWKCNYRDGENMHNKGHTLDVVITRDNSTIMQTTPSVRDPCLFDRNGNPSGDHFALVTSLEISKPPKQRNTVSYRKFSEINTTDLIQDLNNSKIAQIVKDRL